MNIRHLLQLLLLPVLALALFIAQAYIAVLLSGLPMLFSTRPLKLTALLASAVLISVIVAAVFAYPVALAYKRRTVLAAIVVCAPTILFHFPHVFETSGKPFVIATLILELLSLAILVPYASWLVGSRSNH